MHINFLTRSKRRVAVLTLALFALQLSSPFIYIANSYIAAQNLESSSSQSVTSESSTSSAQTEETVVENTTSSESSTSSATSSEESSTSSEQSVSESVSSSTTSAPEQNSEEKVEEVLETEESSQTSSASTSSEPAVVFADKFVASGPNTYVTNGIVQVGVKYVFPLNENVTIEFTKLPAEAKSVTIKQVVLSAEKVAELNAASNVGYEFTTEMVNGTFEYTMTLPNPTGAEASVLYAEEVSELNAGTEIQATGNEVVTFSADHFTVFVVVNPGYAPNGDACTYSSVNGVCYDTIQAAINAAQANPGADTIRLFDGINYTECLSISDSNLTIRGQSRANTVIDTSACTGYGIYVAPGSDNIVFTQFTVEGPQGGTTANYGFKIEGSTNINLNNIIVQNSRRSAVDFNGVNGVSLSNIALTDTISGNGLAFTDTNNVTIGNIRTERNAWAGIAIYSCGRYSYPAGSSNYNFTAKVELNDANVGLFVSEGNPASSCNHTGVTGQISNINFANTAFFWESTTPKLITLLSSNDVNATAARFNGVPANTDWDLVESRINHDCKGGNYTVSGNKYFHGACDAQDIADVNYGSVNYKVDNAPVVTIESPTPAENSYVRGIITGRAVATDDIGMGSYYLRFWQNAFEIAGGGTLVGNCQAAPGGDLLGKTQDVTCDYDTRTNADGLYVFSAQFQDSAINWGQALRQFYVDNTRPDIAFNNPSVANQLENATLTASVSATDNTILNRIAINLYNETNSTFIRPCGSTPGSSSLNVNSYTFTCDLDTTTLSDGIYTLRASATDEAGNVRTTTATFLVDRTAPAVPSNLRYFDPMVSGEIACGTTLTARSIYPRWNANVEADFSHYEYTSFNASSVAPGWTIGLNEQNIGTITEFVHSWVPPMDGVYGFAIRAVDVNGNKSAWAIGGDKTLEDSCSYTVLSLPEVPTLLSPANNSVINASTPMANDWADAARAAGYIYQSYNVDGSNNCDLTNIRFTANYTASQTNTRSIADGTIFCWRVRSTNAVGESAWSDLWKVTIDNSAPDVFVTAPANGAVLNGIQEIRGTVTDANLLNYVLIITDSSLNIVVGPSTVPVSSSFTDTWLLNWNTTAVADGVYTIYLEANDLAGNTDAGSSNWVSVTVDNSAPSVPVNGAPHNTTINTNVFDFTWDASTDANPPVLYEFKASLNPSQTAGVLDTNVWNNTSSSLACQNPLTAPVICSVGAPDGVWYWQVRAIDSLGNASAWSEIWNVTIDTTAPVFEMADFTMDEDASADYATVLGQLITNNPESLTPVCTPTSFSAAELTVDLPDMSKSTLVTCTVTDAAGNTTTASANLIVNNVLPTVTISAAPATTVVAGTTVTLTANGVGGNGVLSYVWADSCSGTLNTSNFTRSVADAYSCNVIVTDIDGDAATASITIDVTEPTPTSSSTSSASSTTSTPTNTGGNGGTGNNGGTNNQGTNQNTGDAGEVLALNSTSSESSTSSFDGSVLGELTCEERFDLAGFVFIDANGNKIREAGETGAAGVRIELSFRNLEGQFEVLETVTTNNEGNWEADVCPATYRVRLLETSLPANTQISGNSEQLITVGSQAVAGLSFTLSAQAEGFNWWPIILLILIALLIGAYFYSRRREEENKY